MRLTVFFGVTMLVGLLTGCENPVTEKDNPPAADSIRMIPASVFIDTASSVYTSNYPGLANIIIKVTNHSGVPVLLFPKPPGVALPGDTSLPVFIIYRDVHKRSVKQYLFAYYLNDVGHGCTTIRADSTVFFLIQIRQQDLFRMKDDLAWSLPGNNGKPGGPANYRELVSFLAQSSFYYRPSNVARPVQDTCTVSNAIKTDSLLIEKINVNDIVYINGSLDRSTQKDPLTFLLGLKK